MAVAALKQKPEPVVKTFHATMLVTRAEEWCVEAESPEDARELLAAGAGYRCHLGDYVHARWRASRVDLAESLAAALTIKVPGRAVVVRVAGL
jgi:hypothetical protein